MKVLIADDEALSRRLLQKTLERAGYEVESVENGYLASEQLCRTNGPRLALLDWMMPELDGPGVCRQVRRREDHPYVYMILLTSKESKEDVVAGLESGADDYLTKPFDPEELKARLRTGLRILELEDGLVEAREKMRFQATHDALTKLWNRGVIMEILTKELVRSYREDSSTVVILCDLDHFKKINDTYGHTTGDQVLQEAARRLSGSVRTYDYVGRYGGEEFLIILNNCSPDHAEQRGEQIRRALAESPFETTSGPLNVTMSMGMMVTKKWGALPVAEVLSEADLALYSAKAAGRNCMKVAVPQSEPSELEIEVHSLVGQGVRHR